MRKPKLTKIENAVFKRAGYGTHQWWLGDYQWGRTCWQKGTREIFWMTELFCIIVMFTWLNAFIKTMELYTEKGKLYNINYISINLTFKILPLIIQRVSSLLWAETFISLDSEVIYSLPKAYNLGKVPYLQL